jgi:xylulokinase
MFTIGYDIGSSFIKAALLDVESGTIAASAGYPDSEMSIDSPQPGWAEQDPETWWRNIAAVTARLKKSHGSLSEVKAIGITYQMHGLVAVDARQSVLRPSIIWCDSRAAEIGDRASKDLGEQFCLENFLNSPGNFTAAKLRWIQEHEPELYKKIFKIMLPGDYIAMKLSGIISTTVSGLSEGILWSFQKNDIAYELLKHWEIDPSLLADRVDTFAEQARVHAGAADELGIPSGIPVSYRAGDQPNNAFSLNVLNPGEIAATAGTSGVVYGITDIPAYDEASRVNTFVHVNHASGQPRYGVLLCVNGTGSSNSWMRRNLFPGKEAGYDELNSLAEQIPPGAEGILVFPFGNGAERILMNKDPGASITGISFNRHDNRHLLRAGQEGVVFALAYGMEIMKDMGIKLDTIKAGSANMFLSPVFRNAFVSTTNTRLELYDTDGSHGAARGAAVGAGLYGSLDEAFAKLKIVTSIEPDPRSSAVYRDVFEQWKLNLGSMVK